MALVQCQHDSSYSRWTAVWNTNSHVSKSVTQPLSVFTLEPNCTDSACIGYLTNQFAAWRRVLLDKQIVVQLVKKLPTICGTQCFVTVFTRARHLPLSWPRCLWFKPFKIILILYYRLQLNLPRDLFLSVSHNTCSELAYISFSPLAYYTPFPSHRPWFVLVSDQLDAQFLL